MKRFRDLPGAALAVGAFVLTVLLGGGVASASALWQQSATATMTVTASGTWSAPVFTTSGCVAGDTANKTIQLSYSSSAEAPSKITASAAAAGGTYGTSADVAGPFNTTGSFTISGDSTIFSQITSSSATVKVVATFTTGTQSTVVNVRLDTGTGNRKVYCA